MADLVAPPHSGGFIAVHPSMFGSRRRDKMSGFDTRTRAADMVNVVPRGDRPEFIGSQLLAALPSEGEQR